MHSFHHGLFGGANTPQYSLPFYLRSQNVNMNHSNLYDEDFLFTLIEWIVLEGEWWFKLHGPLSNKGSEIVYLEIHMLKNIC